MARSVEYILGYLAQNPRGGGFRRDPNFTAAKSRARAIESDLNLARSQGSTIDAHRKRLLQELTAYRDSLQKALDASAPPMATAAIAAAITAANALISDVARPTIFANLPPTFAELLP